LDAQVNLNRQAETQLARALMAGEAEAFERFVEHFRSKIFHYSWLMCGRREDAEEVAQETLLKAFENIAQLRDPEKVRAWIFRVAKNACLMQRRRSVFAPAHEMSIDELPAGVEIRGHEPQPETEYLHAELRAVVDRVIAELPATYRAVVLLRDIEELSTDDVAQILDLSHDVVKTRLHRGRTAMRQKLDCYLHNQCLEEQPAPSPAPLTAEERANLLAVWKKAGRVQVQ
jgi:RNA polymerase sigma-70 factor, ECF subfamily